MEFLQEFFNDHFISWPVRSPDLTPPDFFLWGYVKDNIFKPNPTTIAELKTLIKEAVEEITPAMLKKVFINKRKQVAGCIVVGGGHFEHLL